jgi:heat shock protein HslJ
MKLLVAIAASAVLVASCTGDDSDGSRSSGATPLVGTNWVLTDQASLGVPLGGVAVSARFTAKTVSGESGCNAYDAPYRVDGSAMTIGPKIATTLRACEPGPAAVEHAYLDLLRRVASYSIQGATLSLRARSDEPLLVYRASPGANELIGRWEATAYYTGNAVQSVLAGTSLTADFEEQQVTGESGCNTFRGPYETSGGRITIGPLVSTKKACRDDALMTQEQHYLAALELAANYRVTGSRLELFRADGGIAATFERATG